MNSDTAAVLATPAEARWVEGALVRSLMRTAGNMQLATFLVIPIYVAVLWGAAPLPRLISWALAASLAIGLRYAVIRHYDRHIRPQGTAEHLAFFKWARYAWMVLALVLGASTCLYFDRAPLADQFICWLVMAGVAMLATNSLSSHLPTMRLFLNSLALPTLAVMVWRCVGELRLGGPVGHYWMMLLVVIFWQMLWQAGRRLYFTHRRNFELQYRNNQLIESLTRQTQAALDAVEIKNRFLASATHDIRQPVHALGLYADWLAGEPELVHDIAPKIVESTKAVNALFDSLFDLVRLDSGKVKLNIERVAMDKLLRDLELQYRPVAEAKGLRLRVRLASGSVLSDPILLRRLVGNLISNAVKYTQRGGVLVAARSTASGVCMEIWDTGVGIAPVHQKDIFREFYKVPSHSGTEDGFGLGLYIVARLCHILGHPLELASKPGRGTMFRLRLADTDPVEASERAVSINQLARSP